MTGGTLDITTAPCSAHPGGQRDGHLVGHQPGHHLWARGFDQPERGQPDVLRSPTALQGSGLVISAGISGAPSASSRTAPTASNSMA